MTQNSIEQLIQMLVKKLTTETISELRTKIETSTGLKGEDELIYSIIKNVGLGIVNEISKK